MTKTRAVLFDLGGTLFTYAGYEEGRRRAVLAFAERHGIEPERAVQAFEQGMRETMDEFFARHFYLHRDLFDAELRRSFALLGVEATPEELQAYRAGMAARPAQPPAAPRPPAAPNVRPGVYETLEELRRRGLHLGIVSNSDHDQIDRMVENSGVAPYFDDILCSEEAQSCKPHEGIFLEALRRAGCKPEEALFVGDTIDHDIEGANRVGMRTVLIDEPTTVFPKSGFKLEAKPDYTITEIPELLEIVETEAR